MYHFVTAYFQQYMADFEPIFSLTDDLSVAITNTLKSTHNKHQSTVHVVCVRACMRASFLVTISESLLSNTVRKLAKSTT